MSKRANALLISTAALVLAACSSAPVKDTVAECNFPGSKDSAPGWVCDHPVEGVSVGAVGSAAKTEAGFEFMKQMAATTARVQLAQNMKVHVTNMIKQYAETVGAADKETVDRVNTSVTKQITDQTIQGTRIFRSAQAPDGRMYVLVGLDEATAKKLAESAVKSSINNDQAAWQQFRSNKGQDELAADITKQNVEQAQAQ